MSRPLQFFRITTPGVSTPHTAEVDFPMSPAPAAIPQDGFITPAPIAVAGGVGPQHAQSITARSSMENPPVISRVESASDHHVIVMARETVSIGRDSYTCDLRINSDGVADQHALIMRADDGAVWLKNVSGYPTAVWTRQRQWESVEGYGVRQLTPGDFISVGSEVIRIDARADITHNSSVNRYERERRRFAARHFDHEVLMNRLVEIGDWTHREWRMILTYFNEQPEEVRDQLAGVIDKLTDAPSRKELERYLLNPLFRKISG